MAVMLRVLGLGSLIALAAASVAHGGGSVTSFECGGERWPVKTLQDDPVLNPTQRTTLHELVSLPAPRVLPDTPRLLSEFNTYTVVARVWAVVPEADGDVHLLLRSGKDQMIAESPNPGCTTDAPSEYRSAMTLARSLVRVCRRARLTGVAFFDLSHKDAGVGPNAFELHPILGFHCLNG